MDSLDKDDFEEEQELPLRRRILTDCFPKLTGDDAVALVGVLFEYRIRLAQHSRSPLLNTEYTETLDLEALEPQTAADLVGGLFSFDCDELFRKFHDQWHTLRKSESVLWIKTEIESHPLVSKMIRKSLLH